MENRICIRPGTAADVPAVHALIVELAVYEREPDAVINTPEEMVRDGYGERPLFETIVAEVEGRVVGFALFYTAYSTWKGPVLYLEDFLVTESWRRKGVGELLFTAVKAEASKRGVRRMDWQVLDWNEPAINFYKKAGAMLDPEWINARFAEEDLKADNS